MIVNEISSKSSSDVPHERSQGRGLETIKEESDQTQTRVLSKNRDYSNKNITRLASLRTNITRSYKSFAYFKREIKTTNLVGVAVPAGTPPLQ